jgi:RNA polymerase sigma-70 factor (ECF subfamily)
MVERLPEVERQAIYLFYLEEMSIKELAKVFDVPTGTVKSRLNRARTRLKKLVGDTE